ncbi:SWIM zinc finger protein [Bradyrhizobium macuxiense]|uniref:SWIM zinc finger protein n=1 Tax=Bradyrhizobium macuxiense TaxID=1755647 RepID=A0A560MF38_9BRAD|nr:SWIM zinc finger family protein [Bradyrhizobium macuxiense]TWC05091.1 SWIM zinc finger protein [Bradyrhizobium macuxiense]
MNFAYRFLGSTSASSDAASSSFAFAPDTLRQPTFFTGKVARHLAFREAISALHHVVVSDLRFKPRDRTAYFEWLKQNEANFLAEATAQSTALKPRIADLQDRIRGFDRERDRQMKPFWAARQAYFNYLYKQNRDAWIVLDPVITVHPDEIFFECFSLDESSYGRLSCDHDVFEGLGEMAFGTTNIDYSHALYDEFQKIRSYRDTTLTIDPSGFEVQTGDDLDFREEKIDLPDSWVRGFLQVSSAMTLPAHVFDLHPVDMANILTRLAQKKEKAGPRSLRFVLKPDAPVEVVIEPWHERLTFRRSIYRGTAPAEIRIWGRRRLAILGRALPLARSVRVHLTGTGLPSFFVVDFGGLRFTLGLSGWTANDWSSAGQFDLLAPRHKVDNDSAQRIFAALGKSHAASAAELARQTGVDQALVHAALTSYTQAGRVMFDLDKSLYRLRELTREPLSAAQLRFASPQEEKADRLIGANLVTIGNIDRNQGVRAISGSVLDNARTEQVNLVIDDDDRLVEARCSCHFYGHNKMMRGPCEHMLALRRIFHSQVEGVAQDGPTIA